MSGRKERKESKAKAKTRKKRKTTRKKTYTERKPTADECKRWMSNKRTNPRTGRPISGTGTVFPQLLKACFVNWPLILEHKTALASLADILKEGQLLSKSELRKKGVFPTTGIGPKTGMNEQVVYVTPTCKEDDKIYLPSARYALLLFSPKVLFDRMDWHYTPYWAYGRVSNREGEETVGPGQIEPSTFESYCAKGEIVFPNRLALHPWLIAILVSESVEEKDILAQVPRKFRPLIRRSYPLHIPGFPPYMPPYSPHF